MDTTQSVEKTLLEYEELVAMRDVLRLHYQDARDAVIPDDVKVDLENVDAEFKDRLELADTKVDGLKKLLQEQVKALGQRVDGAHFQVVYRKPSWKIKDLVKLVQLAIRNPEIMECLEQTEGSAAVQVIRKGG